MGFEIQEFERLLDAKIEPLRDAITKLEEAQERIVIILTNQARQDESIRNIRIEVDKCVETHNTVFKRIREVEQSSSDKTWDMVKLAITAVVGGIVAHLGGRVFK